MANTTMFPGMTLTTTPYKQINGHDLLISWWLFGGHALWLQPWRIEYAKLHSAIIVGVDYRLMPEHNGLNMMEDLKDLQTWLLTKLQAHLGSESEVDLDKIMIEGDSAGGYLPVQFALDLGNKAKALLAVYPTLDIKMSFFTVASERSMVGFPMYPADTVKKYVATLKGDEVVSTAEPPARLDMGFTAIQKGKFVKMLGTNPSLFPMERPDLVSEIPSMMILHGRGDSVVPYRSSEAFVEKLRELHPGIKVHYNAVPGCEHGLDAKETMETSWLKEGLNFITPLWLE